MTPAVYIAQLLCPERHAVLALAHECESDEKATELADLLLKQFELALRANLLNPWCGLCASRILHVETKRTGWATMEEATPHLKATEEANLQTAAMWKASRN